MEKSDIGNQTVAQEGRIGENRLQKPLSCRISRQMHGKIRYGWIRGRRRGGTPALHPGLGPGRVEGARKGRSLW